MSSMIIATGNRYFLPFSTLSCRSILRALSSANNGTNIMCLYVRTYVCRVTAPPHMTRTHLGTHTHKSLMKKKSNKKPFTTFVICNFTFTASTHVKCHDLLLCELLVYFCLFSIRLSLSLFTRRNS